MIIRLKTLRVSAIFGAYPEERLAPQELILNVELVTSVDTATVQDKLARTLNYAELYDQLVAYVRTSEHLLLETLVDQLANICLTFDKVIEATVEVGKPAILPLAEQVSVSITRRRAGATSA